MRDDTLHRIEASVNETKQDIVEIKTIVSTLASREFVHNTLTDHYRNCSKGLGAKSIGVIVASMVSAIGAVVVLLLKN